MIATTGSTDLSLLVAGSRIEVRDAEWRVIKVLNEESGGKVIECEGVDELVRGKKSMFLENIEGIWDIRKCSNCGLVQLAPMLKASELIKLYPEDNYYAYDTNKHKQRLKRIVKEFFLL